MPKTNYAENSQNAFMQKFYGRLKLEFAISYLHFYKEGITQQILHNIKYRGQPEIGEKLGEWFGRELSESGLADTWDTVIPIPLHISKEKRRGYNQSNYLASGIASAMEIEKAFHAVVRSRKSETQTRKTRQERWENVEGIFEVRKVEQILGKHVLLVDDVVTTGATLESCGRAILDAGADKLSLATLAIAH